MAFKTTTTIIACLATFLGVSQTQLEVSPSLQEAIEKAIDKNAAIKNKLLEVEKINTERKSVWNKYIPKIEGSANYMYFDTNITVDLPTGQIPVLNQPIFDEKTSFDNYGNILMGSLMVKTVLFSGFQIENGAKALAQKQQGTTYLAEAEKENLVKEVIHAFDQIRLLNAIEILLEDSQKRLAIETKRVERAIEEGLAIPYDRDKIKLANLELEGKKIELEGNKKVLFQKINYLTGYTLEEINQVNYLLTPYSIPENLSTENKQELKALASYKKASAYAIKKEKGSYLPVLGAFGGVSYTSVFDATIITPDLPIMNNNLYGRLNEFTLSPNWMLGVSMKWELFSGFERKHKIHEAKLNALQIDNKLTDAKEKFNVLLENNISQYQIQNQKYQIGLTQEKVASHNLNMAIKQYQEGLINISQRLEAENDLLKAATSKVNALINQRLAALEAILVTGELTNTVLTQ